MTAHLFPYVVIPVAAQCTGLTLRHLPVTSER